MRLAIPSRSWLWLTLFVVTVPVDLLTGYAILNGSGSVAGLGSPSQILRVVVSSAIIAMSLKTASQMISVWMLAIFFTVLEVCWYFVHDNAYGLQYGLIAAFRFMVLFACITLSMDALDARHIMRFGKIGLLAIATSIIYAKIAGIGEPTYGSGGFGTKFFFPSGNAVGMYLGAGTLALISVTGGTHKAPRDAVSLSLIEIMILFGGLLCLGSKAAFFFLGCSVLFMLFSSGRLAVFGIAASVAMVFNLLAFSSTLARVLEIPLRRFENASGDLLFFLTSGRNTFIEDALQLFLSQSSWQKLVFGGGAFLSFREPESASSVDLLEADLFDVFFCYGVIGIFVLTLFWFTFLRRLWPNMQLIVIAFLLLLHSMFIGHVLFNGLFIQMLLFMLACKYVQANDKDNVVVGSTRSGISAA